MSKNLMQYASMLVAAGCKLDYKSDGSGVDIIEYPKEKARKEAITNALVDINLFEDTANHEDGLAALPLSDFTDGVENPLPKSFRLSVLRSLGILNGEKFVSQVLASIKTTRSWHVSEIAGACSFFGEICTHRGLNIDPHRRGKRSNRNPTDYHRESSRGIAREQLVTPALEVAYNAIPQDNLISATKQARAFDIKSLEDLKVEDLNKIIHRLETIVKGRNDG